MDIEEWYKEGERIEEERKKERGKEGEEQEELHKLQKQGKEMIKKITGMTEKEKRERILEMVCNYCQQYEGGCVSKEKKRCVIRGIIEERIDQENGHYIEVDKGKEEEWK